MKTTKIIALALTIITASSCKDNKTEVASKKDLEENLWVCPSCNKHHRITPRQRFDIIFGKNNYEVLKTPIPQDDPLNWHDSKHYKDR